MTITEREASGTAMARRAVASAKPRVLAAAKALCAAENIPWDAIDIKQQYTFCADAQAALNAADKAAESGFDHAERARIALVTGISLQTVTEVVREWRRGY